MYRSDDTWTHQYISRRPYLREGYSPRAHAVLTVTAGLHQLGGNARPYFSVTGEIRRPRTRGCDSCGCLHEAIAATWPRLRPIIDLHLSDDTGAPMHAVANGWYAAAGYYGGAGERYHAGNAETYGRDPALAPADRALRHFASHVRVSVDVARAVLDQIRTAEQLPATVPPALRWIPVRRAVEAWIDAQRPRWQQEADAGCQLLDQLISEQAARRPAPEAAR